MVVLRADPGFAGDRGRDVHAHGHDDGEAAGGVAADAGAEFVAELAGRAAVEGQRVVLVRQQLGIRGRNELECVVATRRRRVTQPDLSESAASEEAEDLIAVEFMPGGKGVVACRHAEMELLDAGALMKRLFTAQFHHCLSEAEALRGALMKLLFGAEFHHCLSEAEALRGAARNLLLG